jgi:lysophospholipase L1-like esterase
MADVTISQLPAKTGTLENTDLLEVSESTGSGLYSSKKITGQQIRSEYTPAVDAVDQNFDSENVFIEEGQTIPDADASFRDALSTFSGWGCAIGNPTNFNFIRFKVGARAGGSAITQVNIWITENDHTGTILTSKSITGLAIAAGTNQTIEVQLDPPITNVSAQNLYFVYACNALSDRYGASSSGLYFPQPTYARSGYLTGGNLSFPSAYALASDASPNNRTIWLEYGDIATVYNPSSQLENSVLAIDGIPEAVSAGELMPLVATEGIQLDNAEESFPEAEAGWVLTTSTFSGFGTPVGVRQNFDAVKVRIRARATPITEMRIQVREQTKSGTILADKTLSVNISASTAEYVTFVFDSPIVNSGAVPLYVMYAANQFSDGYADISGGLLYPTPTYGSSSYDTNGDMTMSFVDSTSQINFWAEFGDAVSVAVPTTDFVNQIADALPPLPLQPLVDAISCEIMLPAFLYATEGVQMNLYFDNLINSNFPIDGLAIDVVCTKGSHYEKFWRYTPISSDAGSTSFTINVLFDGTQIATATSTLVTKAATAGTGVTRKLIAVGDSTTAGGQYLSIITTDYGSGPLGLQFIGTKGTAPNNHEGISGWTWALFAGNTSPFWNSSTSQIDISNYLTTNGFTMSSGDWVTFHLGINDMFGIATDSAAEAKTVPMIADATTLINAFQSAVSGIRVGLCITIPPAAMQDAFGNNYQNGQYRKRYLRNYYIWVKALLDEFDTDAFKLQDVYVVPFSLNLDTENNFPFSLVNANSRSTAQIKTMTNGVHPSSDGYYQMGDTLFSFLKGNE